MPMTASQLSEHIGIIEDLRDKMTGVGPKLTPDLPTFHLLITLTEAVVSLVHRLELLDATLDNFSAAYEVTNDLERRVPSEPA